MCGQGYPALPVYSGALSLTHTWGQLTSNLAIAFVGESEDIDTHSLPTQRVALPRYVKLDAAFLFCCCKQTVPDPFAVPPGVDLLGKCPK